MSLVAISRSTQRRPQWMLLIALCILLITILVRVVMNYTTPPVVATPPAPVELSSRDAMATLQDRLRRNPEDTYAYAQLGLGLLQQVRESGDVALYTQAGQAFAEALKRDPQQLDALVGQGVLALALHEFEGALIWADKAWAINPFRAETLGIMVDGQVELGRYDEAVATLQKMVDLRPDLNSYSRVSYLRELHGDVDGAIEAMSTAVKSAMPGTESWLWTMTQLGHLYFNSGDLEQAQTIYQQALQLRADYPYAVAGMARIQAAQGDTTSAIAAYQTISKRLPLPEFIVALGELYEITGDKQAAQQQYDLVQIIQQLNTAAGMNVDLEMALFNTNHGNDAAAALQQARAAYAERATIYAADTLAWALYKNEEYGEAQKYSQEALRLKTQDAILYFHAGLIADALGDQAAARKQLEQALAINPHFSPLYAPQAQARLAAR